MENRSINEYNDNLQDFDQEPLSPIRLDNSSIDLSKSSITCRDQQYDQKWNNSICVNRGFNVSRYSINIEARNDLNKITILLNDNNRLSGKLDK